MKRYAVTVRMITVEEAVVYVDAESEKLAHAEAMDKVSGDDAIFVVWHEDQVNVETVSAKEV